MSTIIRHWQKSDRQVADKQYMYEAQTMKSKAVTTYTRTELRANKVCSNEQQAAMKSCAYVCTVSFG